MKKVACILLLLSSFGVFAQNVTKEELESKIKPLNYKVLLLEAENKKLKEMLGTLGSALQSTSAKLDSLQTQTRANRQGIDKASKELGIKIKETGDSSHKKYEKLDQSLGINALYGIIGALLAVLVSVLLYWLLNKRQKTDKSAMMTELKDTKLSIEENLVKEFGKQTELMDSQLLELKEQKEQRDKEEAAATAASVNIESEPDHSLALKLASEINLIERNLTLMDGKTKGLKQLKRSVTKLKDNLAANGYEMPTLLGQPFNQGMKVIVTNSIPDDTLDEGTEIITKVLIPQVNHEDKMIQTAQIEVSVGY